MRRMLAVIGVDVDGAEVAGVVVDGEEKGMRKRGGVGLWGEVWV